MIYVHNTLKQMIETGHGRWRWQKNTESALSLPSERQRETLAPARRALPGGRVSLAALTKYRPASQAGRAVLLG